MSWFKKLISAPSGESVQLEGIRAWTVRWYSRYGEYNSQVQPEVQMFTNQKDAEYFAKALRDAYKLIRHTSGVEVSVEVQED